MKKVLSLVLSLALIIATMALPISASAANISLLDEAITNSTITLSYDVPGTVHPGDTFDVVVKATASTDVTVEASVIEIRYSSAEFTINNAAVNTPIQSIDTDIVRISNFESTSYTANDPVTLATLNFTVKDNAPAEVVTSSLVTGDTYFAVQSGDDTNYYEPPTGIIDNGFKVTVAVNTYSITVNNEPIKEGKTYYEPDGVTVKVTGTNIKTVTVNNGTLDVTPDATPGDTKTGPYTYTLTDDATYTVTVDAIGFAQAETTTFTLSTADVSAVLDIDGFNLNKAGYVAGSTIEIPVKITGLDTAKAAMVSFNLEYETTKLSLSEADLGIGVTKNDNTIIYGNTGSENGLSNGGQVAYLKFTVLENAVIGTSDIKISNQKLALVKSSIDPGLDTIATDEIKTTVVIVPSTFATITSGTDKKWTNQPYNVTLNITEGVTVKYVKVGANDNPDVSTQDKLADLCNGASATTVTGGVVPVSSMDQYVIIAAVGSEPNVAYNHIETLKFGVNAWYDNEAPELSSGSLSYPNIVDAKNGFTPETNGLTFTDNSNDTVTVTYRLGESGDFVTAGTKLDAQNFNGNLYIVATDAAGNLYNMPAISVKLDSDVPVFADAEISVSEIDRDGNKTLTTTLTDAGSKVTEVAPTVKVYKQDASDAELSDISAIKDLSEVADANVSDTAADNNDYTVTCKVNANSRYYLVATDAAGHEAYKAVVVTFNLLPAASTISVGIVKSGSVYSNVFRPSGHEDLLTYGDTNGKFTYVKISANDPDDATNYTNKLSYKKDNGAVNELDVTTYEFTEPGIYEVTITTTHKTYADDYKYATYKFEIVAADAMPSTNSDTRFNVLDYAKIKNVLNQGLTLPKSTHNFTGGLFSGDVTGDLAITTDDANELIRSIRAGEKPGTYTFNILNKTVAPAEGE